MWACSSTACNIDVLNSDMFLGIYTSHTLSGNAACLRISCVTCGYMLGTTGPRTMFTVSSRYAVNIMRYSAMGTKEVEYVLMPGAHLKVDSILHQGTADYCRQAA